MKRDLVQVTAMITMAVLSVSLVAGPLVARHRAPAPVAPTVTVTSHDVKILPPCDDDAPAHPVTGPCWQWDEGTLAVWPYPYAPAPLYVLVKTGVIYQPR